LNRDASDHVLGVVGKLSRRTLGSMMFGLWRCGAKVLEY
jgi:hypothetical protein